MATIEYFYSAYSAFAYLGARKFAKISKGHQVIHRPYDISETLKNIGVAGFGKRTPAHRDYYFRGEIERWSEYRDAPVMKGIPTHHSKDISVANCMLIAGIDAGVDLHRLGFAMLQSHWRDNSDLSDRETLLALGRSVDVDAEELLETANTPETRAQYAANTQEAIARSVFGSPTYFVDGDMFYGQDRLELVERALAKPFKGRWV